MEGLYIVTKQVGPVPDRVVIGSGLIWQHATVLAVHVAEAFCLEHKLVAEEAMDTNTEDGTVRIIDGSAECVAEISVSREWEEDDPETVLRSVLSTPNIRDFLAEHNAPALGLAEKMFPPDAFVAPEGELYIYQFRSGRDKSGDKPHLWIAAKNEAAADEAAKNESWHEDGRVLMGKTILSSFTDEEMRDIGIDIIIRT